MAPFEEDSLPPETIGDWQVYIHDWAKRKGWWPEGPDRNLAAQVANMHTELSEAWEEIRNNHAPREVYYNPDRPEKPEGFGVELADCVIRILDTAEAYGINIENLIQRKMKYNETRSHRHGGKSA